MLLGRLMTTSSIASAHLSLRRQCSREWLWRGRGGGETQKNARKTHKSVAKKKRGELCNSRRTCYLCYCCCYWLGSANLSESAEVSVPCRAKWEEWLASHTDFHLTSAIKYADPPRAASSACASRAGYQAVCTSFVTGPVTVLSRPQEAVAICVMRSTFIETLQRL